MNKPVKISSDRFNLAMATDTARRGPVLIDFFGNGSLLMSVENFLGLRATDLSDLQAQLQVALHLRGTNGVDRLVADASEPARAAPYVDEAALAGVRTPTMA